MHPSTTLRAAPGFTDFLGFSFVLVLAMDLALALTRDFALRCALTMLSYGDLYVS